MAVSPDGKLAYVTNEESNTVTPIEVASGKAEAEINVGSGPYGVAFSPDGKTAYVTNAGGGTVTPIEVATGKTEHEITVGGTPIEVSFTPDGKTAYVTDSESGAVAPIEVATGNVGQDIKLGASRFGPFILPPSAPTIVTGPGSEAAQTSAILGATVNPNGGTPSACSFEYGTTEAYGKSVPCNSFPGTGTSPAEVTATVSGLMRNQTYHYRLTVTNNDGPAGVGADGAFKTLPNAPVSVTGAATAITQTTSTLNATVNPEGGEVGPGNCVFEYGTTESYGSSVACATAPGSGSTPVAVSANVAGLSPDTTYHYRIAAANTGGTGIGADGSFKTVAAAPSVVTGAASAIGLGSATLNATVNPNGTSVMACTFEYGTTMMYGSSVPCASSPGAGSSAVPVSAVVSGLAANTSYYFRISATNAVATADGLAEVFATLPRQSAGPPEFGRCLKVAAGTGKYSSSKCTAKATGSYEWDPVSGAEPLKKRLITTASQPASKLVLESAGAKIYCAGEAGTGEYSGNSALANVTLKLTGCYESVTSDKCESGASEGEVAFHTLGATLGIVNAAVEARKDKTGLDFKPSSGETVAEFKCASTPVVLRGSVILEGKANTMALTVTLKGAQKKGVQKYTHFVTGKANEDVLELKIGAGSYEQAGLTITSMQTNEEKIEANTVF